VLHLADNWQDMPSDAQPTGAILRRNLRAVLPDGKSLGNLRLVCFDPTTRSVTGLVLASKGDRMWFLPMHRVKEIGAERIVTDLLTDEKQALQPFATDWELRQAIGQRLAADPAVQPLQRSLQIEVVDQQVRLRGYAGDPAQADRIERLVRGVPGVLSLDSNIQTDEGMARAVQEAIRRDATTSKADVQVSARFGVVEITGEAPDRAAMKRIDTVARQVDGVLVVRNMVTVRPARATA
jgi:osmotically-inducible protein OsmY